MHRHIKLTLWLVLLSHLVLMGLYPLMDTTEARYADIARRMLALDDWITPWFDDAQPFWGKPPLSFWLTMLGYKLFGVHEFGARFFYWITSLLVLFVTYQTAKRISTSIALLSIAVLTSFTLFYVSSVAVMTDMVLLLGGVICLFSQVRMVQDAEHKILNSTYFSIGLSIGLLAKGPIALILFAAPLGLWVLLTQRYQVIWRRFSWFLIVLLTMVMVLPWYLIAEQKTPGFLNYFIVGEHWQRFIIPGWAGDLYGNAHDFPRGAIWFFILTATFPWCFMLPLIMWRSRVNLQANTSLMMGQKSAESIGILLGAWILIPLVFFTFSGNVLWTYVLPCLPALAILIAGWLPRYLNEKQLNILVPIALVVVVMTKVGFLAHAWQQDQFAKKSTKNLIAELQEKDIALNRVYFHYKVPFSAKFYSAGQVNVIEDLSLLPNAQQEEVYLIVKKGKVPVHPVMRNSRLFGEAHGGYLIYLL